MNARAKLNYCKADYRLGEPFDRALPANPTAFKSCRSCIANERAKQCLCPFSGVKLFSCSAGRRLDTQLAVHQDPNHQCSVHTETCNWVFHTADLFWFPDLQWVLGLQLVALSLKCFGPHSRRPAINHIHSAICINPSIRVGQQWRLQLCGTLCVQAAAVSHPFALTSGFFILHFVRSSRSLLFHAALASASFATNQRSCIAKSGADSLILSQPLPKLARS